MDGQSLLKISESMYPKIIPKIYHFILLIIFPDIHLKFLIAKDVCFLTRIEL